MAFKNTMHYFIATSTESILSVDTYLNVLLRQDITAKKDKTKYHSLWLKMFIKDGKLQLHFWWVSIHSWYLENNILQNGAEWSQWCKLGMNNGFDL